MRVSVIMPAYNAAGFVRRGLDSIATQTRMPHEVVVSDDGSSDGTADVVRQWAAEHRSVAVQLVQGANGGIAVARNRALRVATGELIALLDADDEMLPQQLECLIEGFTHFPDAALTFGDVLAKFDDSGREVHGLVTGRMAGTAEATFDPNWLRFVNVFNLTLRGNRVPNQCTLMKRAALEACGAWDDSFRAVEDRDLFLRLSFHGKFYFFPRVLAIKHEREAGVSNNAFVMSMYQFRAVSKAVGYAVDKMSAAEALSVAAAEYLYHSSAKGPREFFAARRALRAAMVGVATFDVLKAWARVLIVWAKQATRPAAR